MSGNVMHPSLDPSIKILSDGMFFGGSRTDGPRFVNNTGVETYILDTSGSDDLDMDALMSIRIGEDGVVRQILVEGSGIRRRSLGDGGKWGRWNAVEFATIPQRGLAGLHQS